MAPGISSAASGTPASAQNPMCGRRFRAPVWLYSACSLVRPYTSTSVVSPSMVATFTRAERRTCPTRATISVFTWPIAVSIPARCSPVNRRAIPAAVVDAGVATGSSCCPATSARRRSNATR